LAVVRTLLGLAVLPFAPVLYKEHFVVLVLLRPTKEVLLAGGFLVREGRVGIVPLLLAAAPLLLLGVWHMYALGRGYSKELQRGDLPGVGGKLLPRKRIRDVQKLLKKKGTRLVVLGRLAAMPSSLVGAAAGASGMRSREFLRADAAGAALSLVEVVGAGLLLGEAYKQAGPWLTAVGVAVLVAMLWLGGRYLKRTG
jgi:membrane protein DedA with SNARE-associated domain